MVPSMALEVSALPIRPVRLHVARLGCRMSARPEETARSRRIVRESAHEIGYGWGDCPGCGSVKHYGTPEDEAHCPCVDWEGTEWAFYSGCVCPCHDH